MFSCSLHGHVHSKEVVYLGAEILQLVHLQHFHGYTCDCTMHVWLVESIVR